LGTLDYLFGSHVQAQSGPMENIICGVPGNINLVSFVKSLLIWSLATPNGVSF